MKKIFYLTFLLVFAIILSNSSTQAQSTIPLPCPPHTSFPLPVFPPCDFTKPCGIYIIHSATALGNSYRGYKEYYDGIFLRIKWNELEPDGPFIEHDAFLKIAEDINWANDNGKQVSIAIEAGEHLPRWMVPYFLHHNAILNYVDIERFGNGNAVTRTIAAPPWNNYFISCFNTMISDLHWALSNTVSNNTNDYLIDHITMIKLTGITIKNEETRLPNEDRSFCDGSSSTPATDVVSLWHNLGYTPALLIDAWEQMALNIHNVFNRQYVNIAVIVDPHAFPPTDCYGTPLDYAVVVTQNNCATSNSFSNNCISGTGFPSQTYTNTGDSHLHLYSTTEVPGCSYNVTEELIRRSTDLFSPCLAINSTSLNLPVFSNSTYPLPQFSNLPNIAVIGYQQEHQDYCATCNYWTAQNFVDVINNGMANHASFIELHENTIDHFKLMPWSGYSDVMAHVHDDLVYCHCTGGCRTISTQIQNPLSFSSEGNNIHIKNNQQAELYHFTILDMTGRFVKSGDLKAIQGDNIMDTKEFNLTPSVYILRMHSQSGNSSVYKMFIK